MPGGQPSRSKTTPACGRGSAPVTSVSCSLRTTARASPRRTRLRRRRRVACLAGRRLRRPDRAPPAWRRSHDGLGTRGRRAHRTARGSDRRLGPGSRLPARARTSVPGGARGLPHRLPLVAARTSGRRGVTQRRVRRRRARGQPRTLAARARRAAAAGAAARLAALRSHGQRPERGRQFRQRSLAEPRFPAGAVGLRSRGSQRARSAGLTGPRRPPRVSADPDPRRIRRGPGRRREGSRARRRSRRRPRDSSHGRGHGALVPAVRLPARVAHEALAEVAALVEDVLATAPRGRAV